MKDYNTNIGNTPLRYVPSFLVFPENLRNAVLNFPLNINKNSQRQNFGRMTSVAKPPGFNNVLNDAKTLSNLSVQFNPAKLEKIRSKGP